MTVFQWASLSLLASCAHALVVVWIAGFEYSGDGNGVESEDEIFENVESSAESEQLNAQVAGGEVDGC